MQLGPRLRRALAIGWGLSLALAASYLVYRIVHQARFVPALAPALSDCRPQRAALDDNRLLHHTLTPCARFIDRDDARARGETKLEFEVEVMVNSLGFRNDEYSLQKPPGTTRIVLLGDSFVYGYALELEQTFFKRLERSLNARSSRRVEVWNLAVTSWATVIQRRLVDKHLLSYEPDIVGLFFDDSDFYDNVAYAEELDKTGNFAAAGDTERFWKRRSELLDRMLSKGRAGQTDAVGRMHAELHERSAPDVIAIAKTLEARSVPFFVVFYPYPRFVADHERQLLEPFYARLRAAAKLRIFSLYPAFPVERRATDYFPGNKHWTAQGSERAAARLEQFLTSEYPQMFPAR